MKLHSLSSYLSQEILAEQEVDRLHGLPAQHPVKFNNMVVISLSMKLKEEHCSIGFSMPLTNQNKNSFSYGSMECQNLLLELVDYSVYQCGGCGAVLRAKHKGYVSGSLSDEGKVELGGDSGKSESSLEKGLVDRSDASDVDAKVDNMARCFRTNQRILVRKG
eukprot:XP_014628647.1 uncharacterized protein LOC106797878 [Glycine max]